MELSGRKVLVCDCEGTMRIDGDALGKASGTGACKVAGNLCRKELATFRDAANVGAPLLVACTQEAPLFRELLSELGERAPDARFVNIRERAGWSEAGKAKRPGPDLTAKMAALLAEAMVETSPVPAVVMRSAGELLVLGADETALEAAQQAASRLDVTLILAPGAEVLPPRTMDIPIFRGRVGSAKGHLGAFELTVEDVQGAKPSSRGKLEFGGEPRRLERKADLILDLRGGTPLFNAPEKRDGYFHPDPASGAQVMKALLALTDMVGEFSKPRYVEYRAELCAHSRNGIVGCSRCLDNCPAGAITPDEDKVRYDPHVCAGCGVCASVCPSGAAHYALPGGEALLSRLRTLLRTYTGAGGSRPVLLVHDTSHGEAMVDMMARTARGLPARVLPFAVNQVTQLGIDFLLAATAFGIERTLVLAPPARRDECSALADLVGVVGSVLDGLGYAAGLVQLVAEPDPEALCERLHALAPIAAPAAASFLTSGSKRESAYLALEHLHRHAPRPVDEIALQAGAPFGTVNVDVTGCTLCMSCAGACPTGALKDAPDEPRLSFAESACIQCGICRGTCPEKVITLTPRVNFRAETRQYRVLNEDEPICCIRCGTPFGTPGQVRRILDKLRDHPMFAADARLDMLKMCKDCRVIALIESGNDPFAQGTVPRTRTTADYLRERELGAAGAPEPGGGNGEA
jgi:ferredoxin